ncbi:acyltransferase [Pseudodesulfovibrio sp. zrk46]|nr:acyltransferase [Pseudodesulfovibrio sp. zrk46]
MQKRIEWIDIARGIAFLMIIYSHIDFTNDFLMIYFSPIFLTTFFFISGYLFSTKRSFVETLEQRFRTLMIPWLIYGLFNILLSQIVSLNNHAPLAAELIDMFKSIRGENDNLWFLACLFVASIPFYIFIKYIPNIFLLPLSFIFFIVNKFLFVGQIPWYINLIFPTMFFMTLGYIFKQHESHFKFINSVTFLSISIPIYILGTFLYYYFTNEKISFVPTHYIIGGLAITLLGLLICISISKQLTILKSFLVFIGSNSLLYFCLHGKVYSVLQKLYYVTSSHFVYYTSSNISRCIVGIIITILTALILIVPVKIINKFFPFSIGKGFNIIKLLTLLCHDSPKTRRRNHH